MNTIYTLGDDPVLVYAAKEFAKYARKIASVSLPIKHAQKYATVSPGIWLGVCTDLASSKWPALEASKWDDGYAIKQDGQQLLISGTNGRSVLFGVYAYFERLGARWVRPGPRGESLPSMDQLPAKSFQVKETASYRHRGICIEGAPSLEHALNMVDWMAKRRINSFFLQFHHSGTFWERWYSRSYNPYFGQPAHLPESDFYANDAKVIAEVKRRGMLLHQVGHGWTAATVDLPHDGWQTTELQVAPDKKRWLAKVNGKRDIYQRIPVNTELCYSYQPAFNALVNTISAYAKVHPEVDVLHVWLSDAMNNKCECKHCTVMSPADWYVKLVNALADRLYQIDPERRFVFLSYFESWWAPEQLKVETKRGNAILMFAPISRCFRHSLADSVCTDRFALKRPALSKATMPRTNQPFVRLLSKWWKVYTGDSFLFDYYLWSGLHTQATDITLARIIHNDMQSLRELNLNGIVSCQVLRSFWPTGLPMAVMAEAAWNHKVRWQQLKHEHLLAAFGEDASWVDKYLGGIEKLMLEKPEHGGTERLEAKQPKHLRAIEAYLQDYFGELNARADRASLPVHRESFEILRHHHQFLLLKCQTVMGKLEPAELKTWLLKSERRIHPFLDVPALMAMQLRS